MIFIKSLDNIPVPLSIFNYLNIAIFTSFAHCIIYLVSKFLFCLI